MPGVDRARCRLCHSNATSVIAQGRSLKVARCRNCHCTLTLLNEPAGHEELDDFDLRYQADADDNKPLACWQLLTRLVDVSAGQRLLDVGCGRGAFLDVARAHGLRTAGLEPALEPADFASRRHDVMRCHIEDVASVAGQFDLITMWDVLEHLQDAGGALVEVRRLLAPRGTLVVATPMMGSIYDRSALVAQRLTAGRLPQLLEMCWTEDHLTRFDPSGLKRVLLGIGFAQVDVQSILLLSLRPDRYAGGTLLPSWTPSEYLNRSISRVGVKVARLARLRNKVLCCATA